MANRTDTTHTTQPAPSAPDDSIGSDSSGPNSAGANSAGPGPGSSSDSASAGPGSGSSGSGSSGSGGAGGLGQTPALVAIVIAVVLWGLAPVATRYLVFQADPLGVLGIRFAICSLCYLPALPKARKIPAGRWQWLAIAGCGLAGIIGYNLPVTYGIRHIPAGLAGVLLSTEPIWIALLSVLVFRKKPARSLVWALGIAFVGVVVLSFGGGLALGSAALFGAALVLFGAFMWGVYSVAVGPLVRRFGTLPISALTLWAGTIPLVLVSAGAMASAARTLSGTGWLVLLLYGLGPNIIGMLLWNYGLSRVPASRAGLFLYLYPAIGITGGALLLGEPLTVAALAGGALIVTALVLAQDNPVSRRLFTRSRGDTQQSRDTV
jgi:drug/metabolite transporter (DMT)-like permease